MGKELHISRQQPAFNKPTNRRQLRASALAVWNSAQCRIVGNEQQQRFHVVCRSALTGLDYAVNRTYDSKQGRFTQVDQIGMSAVSVASPQTLNLYTYCGNDPINYTDPSGLFFGKLFKWLWKAIRIIAAVVFAVLAVLAFSIGWVPAGIVLAVASAGLIAQLTRNAFLQKLVRFASIALSAYRIYNSPPALTPGTFPTSFASNCPDPPNCAGTIRLPGETVTVR